MHIEPSAALGESAQLEWTPMKKRPSIVYMKKLNVPFTVETNEGLMMGKAGDYVAHDPMSGHFWPISADYVAMHYEEVQ